MTSAAGLGGTGGSGLVRGPSSACGFWGRGGGGWRDVGGCEKK